MVLICYTHADLTQLDDVGLVSNSYCINEYMIIVLYVFLVEHKTFEVTSHGFE